MAARKVAVLTALRNGMPEAVEHTTGTYTPLAINIFSVPTNHFLTGEQIERSRQGLSIIDRCENSGYQKQKSDRNNERPAKQDPSDG